MQIDQVIDNAARDLPEGFQLILAIENGGYGVDVRCTKRSQAIDIPVDSDGLVESAAEAIVMANDMAKDYTYSHNDVQETAKQVHTRLQSQVNVSRQEACVALSMDTVSNLESELGRAAEEFGKYTVDDKNHYVVSVANIDYIFKQVCL